MGARPLEHPGGPDVAAELATSKMDERMAKLSDGERTAKKGKQGRAAAAAAVRLRTVWRQRLGDSGGSLASTDLILQLYRKNSQMVFGSYCLQTKT
jgi:hypothetical protein